MKTLIIYDSVFGNTGKIAQAIHQGIPAENRLAIQSVDDASPKLLKDTDLLIMGSPTRGFRPTPAINDFIRKLPAGSLRGIYAAVFDTRFSLPEIQSSALRLIVKTGGYAASRLSRQLVSRGAKMITQPEGFYVSGEEGPLLAGELQRASDWATTACERIQKLIVEV